MKEGRKLREQVSAEADDVTEYIRQNVGLEFISSDEFDEQLALAIRKVFGIEDVWEYIEENETLPNGDDFNDFENDVRGILSEYGWNTIYEGENEGGLLNYDVIDVYNKFNSALKKLKEGFEEIERIYYSDPDEPNVDFNYDICTGLADELGMYKYFCKPIDEYSSEINDWMGEIEERIETAGGKVEYTESLKEGKKKLKEDSLNFTDAFEDLLDRAKLIRKDGYDIEDSARKAIEDGLIYNTDILELAEHYGVINYDELVERFYDDLYYDLISDLEDDKDTDIDESCKGKKCESKKKLKEGFRGCKEVEIIDHKDWSDPELYYKDEDGNEYYANYWEVEDSMWEYYKDEYEYATSHNDEHSKKLNATYDWSSIKDEDDEEDFNKFVVNNENAVIGDIIDLNNLDESCKGKKCKKPIKENSVKSVLDNIEDKLKESNIEYEIDVADSSDAPYDTLITITKGDDDKADDIICSIVGYAYEWYRDKDGKRQYCKVATQEDVIDRLNEDCKKSVKEGVEEKIVCYTYGKPSEFKSKKEAIKFFKNCIAGSDGAEKDRYTNVLTDLLDGFKICWDQVNDLPEEVALQYYAQF